MIMILSRVRNMIASAAQRACRQPVGGPGIALGIEQVHAATARDRNQRSASAASRTDFRGFRCRNLGVELVPSGLLELSLTAQPLSFRQSTSISAYALSNNVECFARDYVIPISCHGRSNRRHLSLGCCSSLLDDHAEFISFRAPVPPDASLIMRSVITFCASMPS